MSFTARLEAAKKKPNLNEWMAGLQPDDLKSFMVAAHDRAAYSDTALEKFIRAEGGATSIDSIRKWRDSL